MEARGLPTAELTRLRLIYFMRKGSRKVTGGRTLQLRLNTERAEQMLSVIWRAGLFALIGLSGRRTAQCVSATPWTISTQRKSAGSGGSVKIDMGYVDDFTIWTGRLMAGAQYMQDEYVAGMQDAAFGAVQGGKEKLDGAQSLS